jgi:hypothetical protein
MTAARLMTKLALLAGSRNKKDAAAVCHCTGK